MHVVRYTESPQTRCSFGYSATGVYLDSIVPAWLHDKSVLRASNQYCVNGYLNFRGTSPLTTTSHFTTERGGKAIDCLGGSDASFFPRGAPSPYHTIPYAAGPCKVGFW
jgi:hypothetical protein